MTVNGSVCGDGTANGAEQCDDGNLNNGDSCSSVCRATVCGDGIVAHTPAYEEQCDDGNTSDGDGCSSACEPEESNLLVCSYSMYVIGPAGSPYISDDCYCAGGVNEWGWGGSNGMACRMEDN